MGPDIRADHPCYPNTDIVKEIEIGPCSAAHYLLHTPKGTATHTLPTEGSQWKVANTDNRTSVFSLQGYHLIRNT